MCSQKSIETGNIANFESVYKVHCVFRYFARYSKRGGGIICKFCLFKCGTRIDLFHFKELMSVDNDGYLKLMPNEYLASLFISKILNTVCVFIYRFHDYSINRYKNKQILFVFLYSLWCKKNTHW